MIKKMKTQHQKLFTEATEAIQRMDRTALELRSLSSDLQENIAILRDLLARSSILLNQNSGGAIATAMGDAGPWGRGVQPHAKEPPAGGGRDACFV